MGSGRTLLLSRRRYLAAALGSAAAAAWGMPMLASATARPDEAGRKFGLRCAQLTYNTQNLVGITGVDTDGFNHPLKFYEFTEALIRRGYSDDNIQAVLGGNFRRLLGEVWQPQTTQMEKNS